MNFPRTNAAGLALTAAMNLTLILGGCRSAPEPQSIAILPADEAPAVLLRLTSARQNGRSAITFDDLRPDFERHYYPGTCEPQRWKDAVSMVPMEAFDPSLTDLIRERIEAQHWTRDQTTQVHIELTSFQFVFDQREDIEGEFRARYVNWKNGIEQRNATDDERAPEREEDDQRLKEFDQWDRPRAEDKDDETKLAEFIFNGLINVWFSTMREAYFPQGFGRAMFVDLPDTLRNRRIRRRNFVSLEQTTPERITVGKQTGLNCQIQGVVTCRNSSGVADRQLIEVLQHRSLSEAPVLDQMSALADETVDEFCRQIHVRLSPP